MGRGWGVPTEANHGPPRALDRPTAGLSEVGRACVQANSHPADKASAGSSDAVPVPSPPEDTSIHVPLSVPLSHEPRPAMTGCLPPAVTLLTSIPCPASGPQFPSLEETLRAIERVVSFHPLKEGATAWVGLAFRLTKDRPPAWPGAGSLAGCRPIGSTVLRRWAGRPAG